MSRSKTSNCASSARRLALVVALGALVALAPLLGACRRKASPIAELTASDGQVDRQTGASPWGSAPLGTQFFIGDAARTADGSATLLVGGPDGAKILMQGHTVLRFGGEPGQAKISVEAGAIDLAGGGSYALDVGDVKLSRDGTVRVTSRGEGRSSITLLLGTAEVATRDKTYTLPLGAAIDVGRDPPPVLDAGVPDAPPPIDASAPPADAPAPEATTATLEVIGKQARWLAPGETAWKPLPPGPARLPRGAGLRLGPGTTAKAIIDDTTWELASGAQLTLGPAAGASLDAGGARATTSGATELGVAGGKIQLAGGPDAPAEVRLDAAPRETKIAVLRGGATLVGDGGAKLTLARGESAALQRAGGIRVVEAIPSYFDLRIVVGESLTIHDPRPPTSVRFQFDGKCPDGGVVELDRDIRFLTARVTSGKDFANALLSGGGWVYRVRCTNRGAEGPAIASGRISTIRDDGRRPLPRAQGVNDIDADGRNYRISYQSAIPSVAVHVPNPGSSHTLHLASGGKETTFESRGATIVVPGAQLHEGTYTYWVDRDGVKQDKVSTLAIDFDQTAPQVYIEAPINGQPWGDDIDVRGAVLPGWSAAVEAIAVPIDAQRRFAAKVGAPAGNALAIRLAHPQRGVHYYLRRPK